MKNIYKYILFIIIGTLNHRLGTHAQKKAGEKEKVVLTHEYFDQEGRSDAENLFPKFKLPHYKIINDVKKDDKTSTDFKKLLEQLRLLQRSLQGQVNQARRNLPNGYVPNADDKNRFYNVMRQLASSQDYPTIKKIRMNNDEKFLEDSSRKSFRNINPKLYPRGTISNDRTYGKKKTSLGADNVHNLRHSYNDKDLENFMKSSKERNTFQTHEPLRNRNYLPLSANLEQFNELFNRFNENSHIKRRRSRKNEPDNDVRIPFLRHSNSPTRAAEEENLDAIDDLYDKNSKQTTLTVLRTDLSDETMRADINDKIDKFVHHSYDDKDERLTHRRIQDAELDNVSRTRRSTRTQAGYTQDPDTCKTYNDNLVKLWSNLSKYINVTEQPDDLALHNIAMMVQAYLEHHTMQPPETHKTKQQAPRDKVTEILLRIRKTLEDNLASVVKIVKIIKKYTTPFYGDVENEECQQVNEEYLQSSVNSLFKNYQNNLECDDDYDDIGMNMNKRLILRNVKHNFLKPLAISNSDIFKPDRNIFFEGELFEDSHRGKVPNQRSSRYKRLSKRNEMRNDRAPRSSRIENKKPKTRKSLRESSNTRSYKNYIQFERSKSRCKRVAIRKLTIALRPVIERFTLLLECQVDNTLRSELNYRNSRSPYYLYASKYWSDDSDENHNHKEPFPTDGLTRKNTELSSVFETSRTQEKQDSSNEKDDFVRDDGYTWIKKQSDSQVKLSETEDRKSDATNDFDYINTNHDLRSPPVYDDYNGLVKTQTLLNLNPIFTNPTTSKKKKKHTASKLNNKSSRTQQDKNVYVGYQRVVITPEPPSIDYEYYDENINHDNVEKFGDLTRLRQADELLQEKKNTHTYESLSELLQKARDVSLQTPEVAIPFALDTKKGYVELTYLLKYPKMLVYRPQFLVKNIIPYDEFVKTISNFNITNNDVRLIKIVRHLPDKSVKVLFETEDYEEPLQIHNINENSNNIRTKNRRLSILDNIGSIINQLLNKIRKKSSKSNKDKEFSSDSSTSTVVTTPASNALHDKSSEFKSLSTTAGLVDNILTVDSTKSKLSELGSHTSTGQTDININSESSSSQDASYYGHSAFLLPSKSTQTLPKASTSKPKHSPSSVAIKMWDKLKKIIKDEIKKILENMADVSRNIEKLIA